MTLPDKIKNEVEKRILRNKLKALLTKIVSDERADDIVEGLFEESDKFNNNNDSNNSKTVSDDKVSDGNETEDDNGVLSEFDDWLSEKEEEADEFMEEDDGPVTSLDDMEDRIQEKKDKTE